MAKSKKRPLTIKGDAPRGPNTQRLINEGKVRTERTQRKVKKKR